MPDEMQVLDNELKGRLTSLASVLRGKGDAMKLLNRKLDKPAREQLAEILWFAALTGMLEFGDGNPVPLESKDYVKLVELIFTRTDGLPKPNTEIPKQEGNLPTNQNVISVTVFSDHIKPKEPELIDVTPTIDTGS